MIYLVAVLIPPLYFLLKKKWLALVASVFLFFIALICAMTGILIFVSVILWALCSVVAVWDLRKRLVHENAEILATKMAEKIREAQIRPSVMKK
jgi:membrane protein implicated in regulation of membrane protease activity